MSPARVQLRRTKGWRLPPNTSCVTRPGRWGNPFRAGHWYRMDPKARPSQPHFVHGWREASRPGERGYTLIADDAMAVAWFARILSRRGEDLADLRGRNLACWCRPGNPCHADVLLFRANA